MPFCFDALLPQRRRRLLAGSDMNTAPLRYERSPVDRGTKYVLYLDAVPLSYSSAIDLLARNERFRIDLTALLAGAEYAAFRWETPPVTRTRVGRPFEFVLIDSPTLAMAPEPEVFSSHFAAVSQDVDVIAVPNIGRTATLIVPRQLVDPAAYVHLAAFVRGAPAAQIHRLWQSVANGVRAALADRPLWLSTAGGGVSWLHVRIEGTPKYYAYRPYADEI
jgi:hypothetical protein